MDRDRLAARLTATFIAELEEHLRSFNDHLLTLEKEPGRDASVGPLESLLRTAHSLKGAARAVGIGPVESVCHGLEGVLASIREGDGVVPPRLFPLLFRVVDALEDVGARLRDKASLTGSLIEQIMPEIEAVGRGGADALSSPLAREIGPMAPPTPALAEPTPPSSALPRPPLVEPPVRPAPPPASNVPQDATASHVRVPAEKLDALLSRSGELLVALRAADAWATELAAVRASVTQWGDEWRRGAGKVEPGNFRSARVVGPVGERIRRLEKDLDRIAAGSAADVRSVDRAADNLDLEVRRLRMLPFGEACVGIERAVRDVAFECGKSVDLVIEGRDVQLDRSVLQGLKDPILHLVRNAVDHAVETPEQRLAAGKSPTGRVTVSAELRGGQVEVVVADDGAGLDLSALRLQARRNGWPEPVDDEATVQLIFRPGLSTAARVTSVSGRGVGMDVVRDRVEALHGKIDVSSERSRGTRFTLSLPLTLTTLRAVLVESSGQIFALAGTNVRRLVRVDSNGVRMIQGRPVANLGGVSWPLVSLAATLGMKPAGASHPTSGPAVLLAAGDRRAALIVDGLIAEQEIMVKRLGPRIRRVPHIAGATILPSGRIALVLHAADLIRTAVKGPVATISSRPAPAGPKRRSLLVVDDSMTTRTLEQAILESAGYEVRTAADGEAGWRALNEYGADLLVSDVDMPRLDGFGLTASVRASERFRELPVVLVTSRGSEADRSRGVEVGADAYLVKSAFDQGELLKTVARLL